MFVIGKTCIIPRMNEEEISRSEQGLESQANQCFVCGPANPIGLNVRFRIEAEVCRGEFTPGPQHMGYENVTHGGIVFSLLDDVMANWLWLQGEHSFTAKADIRYRAELTVGTAVCLEGICIRRKGRLAQMEGKVIDRDSGFVYAEATGSFMLAKKA
jgi:acyl-coenzyme A thioesterase PaaI-like protein